jgi:hypothetical protein
LLAINRLKRDFCASSKRAARPANLEPVVPSKLLDKRASALLICVALCCAGTRGQQIDNATAVRNIDAAVKWRIDHIAGYTDLEHYKVYRGKDETNPAAEMVVKTSYRPESGKNYEVVSQSGSSLLFKLLLRPLLETEKDINNPAKVGASLMTSANYDMKLNAGGPVQKEGRECWALTIEPRRKAPNLFLGTLWVDASDFTIVRIEGVTSKSPSFWADPSHVMRRYTKIDGFAQAVQAWAESDSFFGRVVVTINYDSYQIQSR